MWAGSWAEICGPREVGQRALVGSDRCSCGLFTWLDGRPSGRWNAADGGRTPWNYARTRAQRPLVPHAAKCRFQFHVCNPGTFSNLTPAQHKQQTTQDERQQSKDKEDKNKGKEETRIKTKARVASHEALF